MPRESEDDARRRRNTPDNTRAARYPAASSAARSNVPRSRRRRRRRKKNTVRPMLVFLVLAVILGIWLLGGRKEAAPPETTAPTETEPEAVHQTSSATLAAVGDILMHMPVIESGYKGGGYDFSYIFRYLEPYVSAADLAVANLETTLCGTDNGYPYSGYPCFNCPDAIVDGARSGGFDILLTANNHSYDTRGTGLARTRSVVEEKGLTALGTVAGEDSPRYLVENANGIHIGMICYTYETRDTDPEQHSLNTLPLTQEDARYINTFDYDYLDSFYKELSEHIADMEAEGAEAIVLFVHWGEEYQLIPSQTQRTMAQSMCELGVDVIIGGHPHVVQPVELLQSTQNPRHSTLCLYSMGNAVSNQRRTNISQSPEGHCEDGVLFSVTFEKYSDGTVYLANAHILPTWVDRRMRDGVMSYDVLPLDYGKAGQWQALYGLSSDEYSMAMASFERTMATVGTGLAECQNYLEQQKQLREEAYQAQALGDAA